MGIIITQKKYAEEDSHIICNSIPCLDPLGKGCSSSDALNVFQSESGRISGFCYSCKGWHSQDLILTHPQIAHNGEIIEGALSVQSNPKTLQRRLETALEQWPVCKDFRGVCRAVHEHYGVLMSSSRAYGTMGAVYYPYWTRETEEEYSYISGLKARVLPKQMWTLGTSRKSKLFAQNEAEECKNQGFLIVTEGELDQLSVAQDMWYASGKKNFYRVTSLPTGGNIRGLINNEEFVRGHKRVIYLYDDDAVGLECANEAREYFKDLIVTHTFGSMAEGRKDSNDFLRDFGVGAMAPTLKKLIRYGRADG